MNYIFVGIGGFVIGGIVGFLIGRKKRKNNNDESKFTVDEPDGMDEARKDVLNTVCNAKKSEYDDMLKENGYYADTAIDEDVEEVDDYFASMESPQDEEESDDPEEENPSYKRAYFISTDDFFTARNDYETVACWYDSSTDRFITANGDDITDDLLYSGLKVHELIRKLNLEETVYWRDEFSKIKYEISESEEGG